MQHRDDEVRHNALGRAKEIGPLAFPRDPSGTPRIAAEIDAAVTRVYPPRNQASESGPRSEPSARRFYDTTDAVLLPGALLLNSLLRKKSTQMGSRTSIFTGFGRLSFSCGRHRVHRKLSGCGTHIEHIVSVHDLFLKSLSTNGSLGLP